MLVEHGFERKELKYILRNFGSYCIIYNFWKVKIGHEGLECVVSFDGTVLISQEQFLLFEQQTI
jgi:hypothetical protein